VFLPAVVALFIAIAPINGEQSKWLSLAAMFVLFMMSMTMIFGGSDVRFDAGVAQMQNLFSIDWIPSFGIRYMMGTDGISFPLVALTTFVSMLAMGASWPIVKHEKAYCVLFLLLVTGMVGVFLALDFFLFYVFWEVMLLPMYFLIGIWGGPRKEYAAIKFFLYTLLGGVLMLIAILMLYFSSDLRELSPQQMVASGSIAAGLDEAGLA
jgi:NADH-quinone oxidoreductase subunit M